MKNLSSKNFSFYLACVLLIAGNLYTLLNSHLSGNKGDWKVYVYIIVYICATVLLTWLYSKGKEETKDRLTKYMAMAWGGAIIIAAFHIVSWIDSKDIQRIFSAGVSILLTLDVLIRYDAFVKVRKKQIGYSLIGGTFGITSTMACNTLNDLGYNAPNLNTTGDDLRSIVCIVLGLAIIIGQIMMIRSEKDEVYEIGEIFLGGGLFLMTAFLAAIFLCTGLSRFGNFGYPFAIATAIFCTMVHYDSHCL